MTEKRSKSPASAVKGRRKHAAPTIDLTATEVQPQEATHDESQQDAQHEPQQDAPAVQEPVAPETVEARSGGHRTSGAGKFRPCSGRARESARPRPTADPMTLVRSLGRQHDRSAAGRRCWCRRRGAGARRALVERCVAGRRKQFVCDASQLPDKTRGRARKQLQRSANGQHGASDTKRIDALTERVAKMEAAPRIPAARPPIRLCSSAWPMPKTP